MPSSKLEGYARRAYEDAVATAGARVAAGEVASAWPSLERAHVLGQQDAWLHLKSHAWMLRCAVAETDVTEVVGQIVRVVLAAPSSWLGRYPVGNTGRARAGLFRPMPVAPEVAALVSPRSSRGSA